ncbi:hypothetical protein F4695_000573 [Rhizobium soli]|uniref:Antitoxin VbhA domain-containing protein n=1 Tax=Rhizobium soli TaxID=424798 RepID=A0A7X0JGN4_9HYPH|nr:hypothetical protein [Rhizobium soli]MBB6507254.1 hypothetical protein [Rhizobium soli]
MTGRQRRKEVFEAARDKAEALGLKFEDDDTYLSAVERWVDGEISAAELRAEYQRLIEEREKERRIQRFVRHCLRSDA